MAGTREGCPLRRSRHGTSEPLEDEEESRPRFVAVRRRLLLRLGASWVAPHIKVLQVVQHVERHHVSDGCEQVAANVEGAQVGAVLCTRRGVA